MLNVTICSKDEPLPIQELCFIIVTSFMILFYTSYLIAWPLDFSAFSLVFFFINVCHPPNNNNEKENNNNITGEAYGTL